ncbi:hypothetical protein NX059_001678 [Plenodomus lindquistii]|nr:hypothetical protein NX059_001678 [Plenodomus lindquistii]
MVQTRRQSHIAFLPTPPTTPLRRSTRIRKPRVIWEQSDNPIRTRKSTPRRPTRVFVPLLVRQNATLGQDTVEVITTKKVQTTKRVVVTLVEDFTNEEEIDSESYTHSPPQGTETTDTSMLDRKESLDSRTSDDDYEMGDFVVADDYLSSDEASEAGNASVEEVAEEIMDAVALFGRRCNRGRAPLRMRIWESMVGDEGVAEALGEAERAEVLRVWGLGDGTVGVWVGVV